MALEQETARGTPAAETNLFALHSEQQDRQASAAPPDELEPEPQVAAEEELADPVMAAEAPLPPEEAEQTAENAAPPAFAPPASVEDDAPKKGSFLTALFQSPAKPESAKPPFPNADARPSAAEPSAAHTSAIQTDAARPPAEEPRPPVVAAASNIDLGSRPPAFSGDALPGVRGRDQLFDIVRRSGMDDTSDIDLYEDEGYYRVASAAGLARLAPNGLLKKHANVDVSCFRPGLVRKLKAIESHYGRPVIVTSGYRSPEHNRRVRGARNSFHMQCAAADIQVEGVSKWELARFVRALPGRGGVGTYCHMASVHVDVGPERDWNWRCPRSR